MDRTRQSRQAIAERLRLTRRREEFSEASRADRARRRQAYFEAAPAAAYFLRNLSTRPAVSTIFCLPV